MKYNPDEDIVDLTGKVIIVTGGTDGLGKESVLQLSKHNAQKIYLAARSQSKAEAAISQIQSALPSSKMCPIEFLSLDLSSFASIKSAAQTFLSKESRLDILLANAGVMGSSGVTTDGYEMTMGVNHLGHALFVRLLLPLMTRTAQSLPNDTPQAGNTRVVILGSEAEYMAKSTYPFTEFKGEWKANIMTKYGQSKLANAHYTQQLALHYPENESGVRFICVHPGGVQTNLGNDLLKNWPTVATMARKVLNFALGLVPVQQGVWNQLWACTAPVHGGKFPAPENGGFYFPVGVAGKGSKSLYDTEMAARLWDWTEEIIGPEVGENK